MTYHESTILFSIQGISLTDLKVLEHFYLQINSRAPQHLYYQMIQAVIAQQSVTATRAQYWLLMT